MKKILVGVMANLLLLTPPVGAGQEKPRKPAAAEPRSAPEPAAPEPFSSEERQELSRRDEQPAQDVAGGALTNQQLTYIVIALAAAVLVLILK